MVFYGGKPTTGHSFISHGCLLFSTCQEGCIGTKIDRWNPCPRMDQFSHGTLSFSFSARTLPCRTSRMNLCLDRPCGIVLRCSVMAGLITEPRWANKDLDAAACISSEFPGAGSALCCWILFLCSLTHSLACPLCSAGHLSSVCTDAAGLPAASCLVGAAASTWASVAPHSPALSQHPWASPPLCALSLQSQPCLSSLTPGTTSAWETFKETLATV